VGIKRYLLEAAVTTMRMACRFPRVKTPLRIFVLRNNNLGDLVAITPLFKALRMAFPDAYIAAGVSSWSKDILKNNPYISEVVDCSAPWHNYRTPKNNLTSALSYIFGSSEAARLRSYEFDVGIDVLGSPFGSMLLMRLKIPIRLGRKGYAGGHSGTTAYLQYTTAESVSQGVLEFVRLLKSDAEIDSDPKPQLYLSETEIEEARKAWLEIEGSAGNRRPRIVIAPGAGSTDKQWPVERFTEFVDRLSKDTCGCMLGSREDFRLGEAIAHDVKGWSNRCGSVSIRQSMALISLADLVICHSSFVMHLAAAFSRQCVVILPTWIEPESHAQLWEIAGIHHHLSPLRDEEHVRVADAENQARRLLCNAEGGRLKAFH
jgi:ADP-heptose:LPS heptosyltransferase